MKRSDYVLEGTATEPPSPRRALVPTCASCRHWDKGRCGKILPVGADLHALAEIEAWPSSKYGPGALDGVTASARLETSEHFSCSLHQEKEDETS